MTFLPMVERELRASARQGSTFHLRVLGVLAALGASAVFVLGHGLGQNVGGGLFADLHFTLFWAIWIFIPFLTADCISRERRDGTLGLLFLTPLRPKDIVVAKGLVHGLRALTLWLVVLPVVAIAFLLGGISSTEVTLSGLVNFGSICLALAAGLVASSLSRVWTRVLICAGGLSLVLCVGFALLLPLFVSPGMASAMALIEIWEDPSSYILIGLRVATNWDGDWSAMVGTLTGASLRQFLLDSAALSLFAFIGLWLAIHFVARRVSRVWREEPPSARILWLEDKFCKPVVFQSFFRRWLMRKLDRNPIGWLEQRSWTGRLVMWSWLGVIVCLYCVALTGTMPLHGQSNLHQMMAWLMGGSMALTAAASFRRERETGVLELLLVSPLGEGAIISGRLRGLCGQFLPAMGLLLGIWVYLSTIFGFAGLLNSGDAGGMLLFASTFLAVPVIGLYFSLRCRSFIAAFLSTLTIGMILPPVLAGLLEALLWLSYGGGPVSNSEEWFPAGGAAFGQLVLAAVCWERLLTRLRRRAFPLEKT
ncbi:MAG TPA: ABC transporter permease subunit [Candidatus Binatia bacterium]|jgi:ABC-type transport system involved in multi-copper enzyme maturation permease subunit|nr:ABC transporter permease subunit [Candidatus Binatia bacterium]